MIKITFWLRKLRDDKESLEYITVNNPKKILEGKLARMYACEVYLPEMMKKGNHLIYADNPIDALCFASDFAKLYLQGLINRGYKVSEVESKEPWKLEKADVNLIAREKINKFESLLKDDKSVSPKVKEELLKNLRKMGGIKTK